MQHVDYINDYTMGNKLVETIAGHFENGDYVFFWNGPFSNWFMSTFSMETNTPWGIMTFTSSEQAMMFYKAVIFNDEDALLRIMATNKPRDQKAIGRTVKGFDQAEWEAVCVDIITEVLVEKFTSDAELCDVLLNTGDRMIVEASPVDKVWGIGMAVDNPDILDESKWDGKNLLGVCLMNAREIIRNEIV